jgi:hypothetical protein
MKKVLSFLALLCLTVITFAQTCPTPNGNSIIIKPSYTVSSSIANQTDVKICYNNTTTSRITALQFKITYDTVAFKNPSVRLLIPDSTNSYLQFYVNKGTITISTVYDGPNLNYTYASGELFNINFNHSVASTFQYLTSISALSFDNSYPTIASTNNGKDTTLTRFNAGGVFVRPSINFAGTFKNVTGSFTKSLLVGLWKQPKIGGDWTLVNVETTDINGRFAFNPIVDTTFWTCKVEVRGDTLSLGNVVTTADAQKVNRFVLGIESPKSFDFHTSDPNNTGSISISDVYTIFNRIAGRFNSFSTPDVRFFTDVQYNTVITDSLTNHSLDIPGTPNYSFTIVRGIDSIMVYVLATGDVNETGFRMARLVPIKITNPLNTPNFIIDQTTDYYASLNEMEINLPTLNVEEGNLVNIPVKVLTNGQSLGAMQLSLKYDKDLLEFKGVASKGATSNWMSFTNANNNEVEWGGVDLSEQNKISDGEEVVVLQFTAKKPKDEWSGSPLYVTRKFVGNAIAKDLSIRPTDGRVDILKTKFSDVSLNGVIDIMVYPNPTSGIVAVQFNIPDNTMASIYFIDLKGNKVAEVTSGKMPKGEYRYTANLTSLPPSAYVAVMECDGKIIASTKLINSVFM